MLGDMIQTFMRKTGLAILVAIAASLFAISPAFATVLPSATVYSPAQNAYYQSMPDLEFEPVDWTSVECTIRYPNMTYSMTLPCNETNMGSGLYKWNPTTASGWGGAFPDGSYEYILDVIGSGGATYYSPFILDSTAPAISITPIAGNSTLQSQPTFYYSVTEANAGSSSCSFDGGPATACAQSTSPALPLAPGAHTVTVTHTDLALNTGGATYQFTVLKPTVTKAKPFLSTSKVKRGKLRVPVRWSFEVGSGASTASACSGTVKLGVTPKGMKKVTVNAKLSPEVGSQACKAKVTFKLPKKAKNRKAKLTAKFAGSARFAAFNKSVSGKRL